ncbi:MAG: hypothetical protein ABEH38_04825 [Flavobacteriales bacterium]
MSFVQDSFSGYTGKGSTFFLLLILSLGPLQSGAQDDEDPSFLTYGGELAYRFSPGLLSGFFGNNGMGNQPVIGAYLGRVFNEQGKGVLKLSASYGPFQGGDFHSIVVDHRIDPERNLHVPVHGDGAALIGRLGGMYYLGNGGFNEGGGLYLSMGFEIQQLSMSVSLDASEDERANYKVPEEMEGEYKMRYFYLDGGLGYEWELGPGLLSVRLEGGVTVKEPPFGAPDWDFRDLTLDQQLMDIGTYIGPRVGYGF